MTESRFSGFWRFALATYRKPGIQAACLLLQERCAADVPVLLYALYVGVSGCGVLTQIEFNRIAADLGPWTAAVVRPLRGVRVALKPADAAIDPARKTALRTAVKRLELQAERIQMMALAARLPPRRPGLKPAQRAADARENLAAYLATLGDAAASGEVSEAILALQSVVAPVLGKTA